MNLSLQFEVKVSNSFRNNLLYYVYQYKAYVLSWNEWVTLPVQFSDLPRTAQLALTVYDCVGTNKVAPVGGTTISLFSKYGVFKQVNV